MRFYRQLPAIEAMTFDLDETLYDNRAVAACLAVLTKGSLMI